MTGLALIEPNELYNLLNQESAYPCLSDPVYMLLLDARQREDYNESHVITAKFVSKNDEDDYVVPYDADLECKTHVVVYDSNTESTMEETPATDCGHKMWEMGSRNLVKILRGGYEEFSALYPFLRAKKIIYMPRELDALQTYPLEVISGLLYLGNWNHGNIPYIQKDLKIRAHINCSVETDTFFTDGPELFTISVNDTADADLYSSFMAACTFIDGFKDSGEIVLVYSKLGMSRSATVVVAYIMHHLQISMKEAFSYVKKCCQKICPNHGFTMQLFRWEKMLVGNVNGKRRSISATQLQSAQNAGD